MSSTQFQSRFLQRFLAGFFVAILAGLFLNSVLVVAGEAPKDPPKDGKEKDKDKKEDEKPKEKEFKFSAWCAFRDLGSIKPPPTKVDPLTEESRPGSAQWEGFGRRGQWTTLVLEVKNTTEKSDYKGSAIINLNPLRMTDEGQIQYTTYYRQDFEIGPGSSKLYTFSVLCPENGWNESIAVDVTANGRSYGQRLVTLHDLDAGKEDFIAVVSEKSGAFRHLATKRRNIEDDTRIKERRVAVVEPGELPTRWHDLMMASLIVLDNPSKEKMSDTQFEALKSYLQAGGHVLIIAGNEPSRLTGPIEDLAGIKVKQMTEIEAINGGESNDVNLVLKAGVKLPLLEISVNPENSISVQRNTPSQLVEKCVRAYGPGTVTFLPYSLSDPLLENWEGRNIIPVSIVDRGRERSLFTLKTNEEDLQPVRQRDAWGNWITPQPDKTSLREFRHELDESFAKDTPVQMEKPNDVLSFMLFYLLCVVPGNYFIFGWFRRREVAWLAVPLWAASFSVLAFFIGYYGKTGQLTASEVSVIEVGSGQTNGMARTFLGLYAPQRDDYTLEFRTPTDPPAFESQAAPGHLLNPQIQTRNIDIPDLRIVDGGRLKVEKLRIQQRSTRRLELMHRAQVGQGLSVKVKRDDNNALSIDIDNRTGFTLYSPVLINEGQAIELGTSDDNILAPNQQNSLSGVVRGDPRRKKSDDAFFGKSIVIPSARGKAANDRKKALSDYLRNQIERYGRNVVVAWMDNPDGCLPVMVGGSGEKPFRPKIEGLTLLVVPTPIKTTLNMTTAALEKAKVKVSTDYNFNTNQGTWKELPSTGANTSVQLKTDKQAAATGNAPNPFTTTAYLTIQLPTRYREMADEGLQLHLRAKLEAVPLGPNVGRVLDGTLEIQVRKLADNGGTEWTELDSQLFTGMKVGVPQTVAPVALPLSNYRAVSNDTLILRVSFTPNDAAVVKNQGVIVNLKGINCNFGRGGKDE